MHLDPTIRTTPLFIEYESHLFSHLDQIAGERPSRGINVNVPFVGPSKSRLNAFQKSELKVFASCVELDVKFIQRPFETKEATCLQLETMRKCYKAKHKANMKREAEVKKFVQQKAKQESKQRAKEKVEEEKRTKEIASKNAKQRTKAMSEEERKVKKFSKQCAMLSVKEDQ
jgi:N-acetylmuramoyl-L-alanine amidase CwlA